MADGVAVVRGADTAKRKIAIEHSAIAAGYRVTSRRRPTADLLALMIAALDAIEDVESLLTTRR